MIKKVVIIGGGFAGWYTAAALKHNFPSLDITVIDSDQHPRLGVGETLGWSAPYDWKRLLGLKDDRILMYETGSIYKYGLSVSDFWQDYRTFNYGKFFNLKINALTKFYGEFEYPDFHEPWNRQPGDIGVQQAWFEINRCNDLDFDDYIAELNESSHFISTASAPYDKNNRYVLRPAEGYSYHIDAEATVRFLKQLVASDRVTHISSAVVGGDFSAGVKSLYLENGNQLEADLFIDASGFARVLTKLKPNNSWVDLHGQFPDSAWVVPGRYVDPAQEIVGGTGIYGEDYGWRFQVKLYHRTGNGYVFNSTEIDPEIPLQRLLDVTDGRRFVEPRRISWSPGFYRTPWQDNMISIGIAAAFVDPYDAPTFDIHSRDLEDLVRVLKFDDMVQARNDYNHQHDLVIEERNLRLLFNFGLSRRRGKFWDSRRELVRDRMQDLRDILNERRDDIENRLQHFWHQMYFRMVMATNTDRRQFQSTPIKPADEEMARSFFAYNRARNKYITATEWPNYYDWLKENRFNGQSSQEVLARLHPNWV